VKKVFFLLLLVFSKRREAELNRVVICKCICDVVYAQIVSTLQFKGHSNFVASRHNAVEIRAFRASALNLETWIIDSFCQEVLLVLIVLNELKIFYSHLQYLIYNLQLFTFFFLDSQH